MADIEISESPTDQPESTTDQPGSPTDQPESPTDLPESPTDQPESPSDQPESLADQPESPTDQPKSLADQSESPTDEPGSPTDQPESPTDLPESPTDQPESPSDQPESLADQPESPTDQPKSPTDQPESPTDQPESPTDLTVSPTDQTESATDIIESSTDVTESATDLTVSPADLTESDTELIVSPTDPTESATDITLSPADLIEAATDALESPIDQTESVTDQIDQFDPADDCARLHNAIDGLGTDEQTIIEILSKRTSEQRQQLIALYEEKYKKSLVAALQDDLSGDFGRLVIAHMQPPGAIEARLARKAMEGFGTDEDVLIDVVCTKNNSELVVLKEAYQNIFDRNLIEDVRGETSGDFEKVLLSILKAERSDSNEVSDEKAETDAAALYKAGEDKLGTDEDVFTEILCKRSYSQLRAIFSHYEKAYGHSIEKVIVSETSGDLKKAYLTVVAVAKSTNEYYARKIEATMKGPGTNDKDLIRYIVSRNEIDLAALKEVYLEKFNKTLEEAITSDTSGDFRTMLLAIISTE